MLAGPNLDLLREVCDRTSRPVVASGGVSTLEDVRALRRWSTPGVRAPSSGPPLPGAFTWPTRSTGGSPVSERGGATANGTSRGGIWETAYGYARACGWVGSSSCRLHLDGGRTRCGKPRGPGAQVGALKPAQTRPGRARDRRRRRGRTRCTSRIAATATRRSGARRVFGEHPPVAQRLVIVVAVAAPGHARCEIVLGSQRPRSSSLGRGGPTRRMTGTDRAGAPSGEGARPGAAHLKQITALPGAAVTVGAGHPAPRARSQSYSPTPVPTEIKSAVRRVRRRERRRRRSGLAGRLRSSSGSRHIAQPAAVGRRCG
jgi:hypothetical protein